MGPPLWVWLAPVSTVSAGGFVALLVGPPAGRRAAAPRGTERGEAPDGGRRAPARHSASSSILRASAKSLSVMPPWSCVLSLTQSLPQVTARSAWCQAASHRKPTALTSMSVLGQPSVLYFRRSQPSS